MKTITATELKARCPKILDQIPFEGLAITKAGKRVATIYPADDDISRLFGCIPGLHIQGDIFSTASTGKLNLKHRRSPFWR